MSAKDSITTINGPQDYFAGVSRTDSTRQCAQSLYLNPWFNWLEQSEYAYLEPKLVFGWKHDVSGGKISHVMSVRSPETSLEPSDTEAVEYRIACHYLLDLVTDEGLPELFECLKDNIEFYKAWQTTERPQLAATTGLPVKLGHEYNRPVFQLSQE